MTLFHVLVYYLGTGQGLPCICTFPMEISPRTSVGCDLPCVKQKSGPKYVALYQTIGIALVLLELIAIIYMPTNCL